MTLTREMEMQVEEEIRTALVNNGEHIDYNNCETIFTYKKSRGSIIWDLVCCSVCSRPNLLHADPWSDKTCSLTSVNIYMKAEYIERLENNKVLKVIAKRNIPAEEEEDDEEDLRQPRKTRMSRQPRVDKTDDKCKFPIWRDGLAWNEYEPMIRWYQDTSKKEPKNQFIDMINGLNDLKKEDISKRLMQNFRGQKTNPNIMDEAVKWIEQNYGSSIIDRIKEAAEFLQTIKRQEDEDMANFIIRLEAGLDKLKSVKARRWRLRYCREQQT